MTNRFAALAACWLTLVAVGCGESNDGAGGIPPAPSPSPSLTRTALPATPTPTSTAASQPTATASAAASATRSFTATAIPTATQSPSASATASSTTSPTPGGVLRITAPPASVVDSFNFAVSITAENEAPDSGSLTAQINGQLIALTGGPLLFSALINPGPPLRDTNTLIVHASFGGRAVSAQKEFTYGPPKALARRINEDADLIHGPLAHSRIGDYLLANGTARFVIQDVGKRDLYSVGTYGGNIIDAELVGHPGLDNFLEIQPALNIETVINAQTVEIVNDGQDGLAAVIRTCGPDDVLDFINPSTTIEREGIGFPANANDKNYDIDGCTRYTLPPLKSFLKMETTVYNHQTADLPLFVGDYINASGEIDTWAKSTAGIGEALAGTVDTLSYIGVGEASGVDYSLVPVPNPEAPTLRSGYLTTLGVTYLLFAQSIQQAILGGAPVFVVPASGQNSFTRYFGVGDGNGGNAVAIENEVRGYTTGTLQGCVTQSGRPALGTRVSVFQRGLVANYSVDQSGCFSGSLREGAYRVAAGVRGSLFEGSGVLPQTHDFTITAGETTRQDIVFPPTGRVHVQTKERRDGGDHTVPARVTVIGFDPSVEPLVKTTVLLNDDFTGIFSDVTADPLPFGVTWVDYTGVDGEVEFPLEPGTYHVYVSRGPEYSAYDAPLTVDPDATAQVNATIVRVLDTTGFVSSDLHVHGIRSVDSRVNDDDRALQFAGEGVDNIVLTDHNSRADLSPHIAALGLSPYLHATIGEEITTWDYGHFSVYPVVVDSTRPSGGSIDWAGAAPPGDDFASEGAYCLDPTQIAAAAQQADSGSDVPPVVQVNHIDTYFAPLLINSAQVPPQSHLSLERRQAYRLDPAGGELFHAFAAMELWNGATRGAQANFLFSRFGIWINLLNQGLFSTAVAGTDSHMFRALDAAGVRTWTAASTDDPAQIDSAEVAQAIGAGKAVFGQGAYIQARLVSGDGQASTADFSRQGATLMRTTNGSVDVDIRVQAPLWGEFDQIEIYANAATVQTKTTDTVPVLFAAFPTRVLRRDADFTVDTVNVDPSVPGAQRLEAHTVVHFTDLTKDTWFVVLTRGLQPASHSMWPIVPSDLNRDLNKTLEDLLDGNLDENAVNSLAVTNALFADVDGEPGFQAVNSHVP